MQCILLAETVSPQTRPKRCGRSRRRGASVPCLGSGEFHHRGHPSGRRRHHGRQAVIARDPVEVRHQGSVPCLTARGQPPHHAPPFTAQPRHERRIPVGTIVQKKLFTPVQIGPITLKHRVVRPPMSRLRAQPGTGIPSDLQREYYTQRASEGGLIITEATAIAASGRGYYHAPGLYADEHVAGWKRITDAVHAKGAYFFTQLWHAGRTTHVSITGSMPVTASVDPTYWADPSIVVDTPDGFRQTSPHRALETAEIAGVLEQYRAAAQNAEKAGFDGVELMAANGHLMDQFLQDNTNKRTDQYGGTVENRMRLLVEVVQTLTEVWGADRVGVRLAPSGRSMAWATAIPVRCFARWQ